MEACSPELRKVLLKRDPNYIPGYSGYCPQLKFQIGKPYGQLTAKLKSPDPHSDSGSPPTGSAWTLRAIPERHSSRIIPGYTGFVPKRQNYVACSYSETCRRAFSDFYQERYANIKRESTALPLTVNYGTSQQSKVPRQKETPLTPISNKTVSYKPLKPFIPIAKPYLLDDDHPYKYFMSGFTGHVPKSRFLIGKGYPVATNEALTQFGRQLPSIRTIDPSHKRGVVPSFTGHIPGYKFMYGHTFGRLSRKALEKTATKRAHTS
ncbi:protein FAM166B isoform X2 [Dunckerocampus dactyliophorus]|uniref:protein FAM166B isoform X2 n=1 Tax=Dunckerocampus dactyliophorus TaxID=161453 RepID=UPI0024050E7A|nr:protein FAM166B isoform X2 [Dunckerocampus dactyliophorus]